MANFETSYLISKKTFESLQREIDECQKKEEEEEEDGRASEEDAPKTKLMEMREILSKVSADATTPEPVSASAGKKKKADEKKDTGDSSAKEGKLEPRVESIANFFTDKTKGDVTLLLEHISKKLWRDTLRWDEKNYNIIAFNNVVPRSNLIHILKYLYAPSDKITKKSTLEQLERYSEKERTQHVPPGTIEFLDALGDDPELGADAWGMNPLRYGFVQYQILRINQVLGEGELPSNPDFKFPKEYAEEYFDEHPAGRESHGQSYDSYAGMMPSYSTDHYQPMPVPDLRYHLATPPPPPPHPLSTLGAAAAIPPTSTPREILKDFMAEHPSESTITTSPPAAATHSLLESSTTTTPPPNFARRRQPLYLPQPL